MDRLTGKHYDRGDYYMECSGSCANDDEMCGGCPWLEKIINRLGAYEDTGLEPETCAEYKKFEDEAVSKGVTFKRIIELMEAEKDGRLVVLPFSQGKVLLDRSYPERPKLLKNFRVAISYEYYGILFHQPLNIFMDNVSKGFISQVSKETNAALKGCEDL